MITLHWYIIVTGIFNILSAISLNLSIIPADLPEAERRAWRDGGAFGIFVSTAVIIFVWACS